MYNIALYHLKQQKWHCQSKKCDMCIKEEVSVTSRQHDCKLDSIATMWLSEEMFHFYSVLLYVDSWEVYFPWSFKERS